MKTISIPFAALFLIACLQTANAQEKKFEVLAGGGLDAPVSPGAFTDEFNVGWTAKLAAGYFIAPRFTLGANVSLNRFGFDESRLVTTQNPDISGNDLLIVEFAGVGKYYVLPRARAMNFYVLGGPGVAYARTSDLTTRSVEGELVTLEGGHNTHFMLTAGAGVTYHLTGRWGLFVEGRYSYLFTEHDDTAYLPIRAGIVL